MEERFQLCKLFTSQPMLLNNHNSATITLQHGIFQPLCHRQFVKEGRLWWHHRPQWHFIWQNFGLKSYSTIPHLITLINLSSSIIFSRLWFPLLFTSMIKTDLVLNSWKENVLDKYLFFSPLFIKPLINNFLLGCCNTVIDEKD